MNSIKPFGIADLRFLSRSIALRGTYYPHTTTDYGESIVCDEIVLADSLMAKYMYCASSVLSSYFQPAGLFDESQVRLFLERIQRINGIMSTFGIPNDTQYCDAKICQPLISDKFVFPVEAGARQFRYKGLLCQAERLFGCYYLTMNDVRFRSKFSIAADELAETDSIEMIERVVIFPSSK